MVKNTRDIARLSRAELADPMRAYYKDVGSHELLTPEQEVSLARTIETRELEAWRVLLGHESATEYVLDRVAEEAGDDMPDTKRIRAAARRARRERNKASRVALDRAGKKVAAELRGLGNHWDCLARIVRHLHALPANEGRSRHLPFRPESKTFSDYLARVKEAEAGAATARNAFVNANLRLVFSTARHFSRFGVPFSDLVQEGNLGLLKAVDRFDVERGFRFSTYAGWWIRHMVGRAVANRCRAVRVPVYLQEIRQKVERTEIELERTLGREPSDAEIAEVTGVAVKKIAEARLYGRNFEMSLDAPAGEESDTPRVELFRDPSNGNASPFDIVSSRADGALVAELVERLPARERDVIRRRFGLDRTGREWTLSEIAADYGLSRERIRQIQKEAMAHLRALVEEQRTAA